MNWLERLFRRSRMEEQLDKELRFHVEQHAADLIARGVPSAEAYRQARLAIGGPEQVKEDCRDARGTRGFEELLRDLRHALRVLRLNPGFTTVGVLTLALGIGAVTAIFSAVRPILFEPLPYPGASQIVTVWYQGPDRASALASFGTYKEIASRSRMFDAFAVARLWQPTLTGPAEPERIDGQMVSAGYFRVLGVMPQIGRDFDPADNRKNGPNVVMLSDALWRRRFHADPTIAGREITLNDNLFRVAGVMPPRFENVPAPSAEIWSLLQYDSTLPLEGREWGFHLRLFARLRPHVSLEQGERELDQIASTPVPEFQRARWASMQRGLILHSLQDDVTRGVKPALLAVFGAVILVLAIACVNVTNLLLARGAQRRSEFAMRAALGAGRARLIRQLLAESLLLTIAGGAFGMLVAQLGVSALVSLSPPDLPRVSAIHFDVPIFVFGFAITMLIGLAVGLVPAIQASRSDLHVGEASRRTAGSHGLMRRALVATEVALATVLLIGAGLLLRSIERLFNAPAGFDPAHVLTMQVDVASARRFPNDAAVNRFYAQALDAVRAVPGVSLAAFSSGLPLAGFTVTDGYAVRFESDNDPNDNHDALRAGVTPDYFDVLGIPLIRGRLFNQGDMEPIGTRPVLVSKSFAARKFPGRSPLGQRIAFGGASNRPWDEIVGVVGDVKQLSLAGVQNDSVYVPTSHWLWTDTPQWLVVRSQGNPAALTPAIKKAIWAIDKDQPIVRVSTMDHLVAASAAERRFAMILFEAFAIAALALAAIGIFGVLSGSVTERTREIGVRAALGASRGDILGLIIRQGMILTVVGGVAGLGAAVLATGALAPLLFGVSRHDPVTYGGVFVLLAGVAMFACWIPAWRAARVDPSIALRAE